MKDNSDLKESVIELIELATIDSPYTKALVKNHNQRLVQELRNQNRIDQLTADYLLE